MHVESRLTGLCQPRWTGVKITPPYHKSFKYKAHVTMSPADESGVQACSRETTHLDMNMSYLVLLIIF